MRAKFLQLCDSSDVVLVHGAADPEEAWQISEGNGGELETQVLIVTAAFFVNALCVCAYHKLEQPVLQTKDNSLNYKL